MEWLTEWLLFINLAGLYLMWADKQRAKRKQWRISEKTLFLVALLGGALGIMLGMQRFRHKTKHWYFKYGMPVIFLLEAATLIYTMWRMR